MAITVEARTKIVEMIVGLVDAAPGADILSELVEIVDSGVSLDQLAIALANNPAFKVLYPDTLSNEAFASNFLSLLYGSEIDSGTLSSAVEAMASDLNSGVHRGTAMYSATTVLAAKSEDDPNFGNAAKALNNKTQVANYYSVSKQQSGETLSELQSIVSGVSSSATSLNLALENVDSIADRGQTISLGLGTDTASGTLLNDTFIAVINAQNPAKNTLVAADSIDGKGGSDTLSITASGENANGLPAAKLESMEVFSIRDVGTISSGNYDFSMFFGETQVINNGSTNAAGVSFSKLGSGASLKILSAGNAVLGPVSFSMENSSDAIRLVLDGGIKNLDSITRDQTGTANVTIVSTGSANSVASIDLDTNTAINSLTIEASADFTTTLNDDFDSNATILVKGSASLVDLDGAILSKNVGLFDASGLASGGVHLKINQDDATPDTKFVGSSGDDILNIGRVNYSNKSITAVGGAGNDVLIMDAGTALTADSAKYVTGFQTLILVDNNDDAADEFRVGLMTEIEKIFISSRSVNDKITLSDLYESQARNITITGNQNYETMTFNLLNATLAGRKDTLELTFDDGLSAQNTIAAKAIESLGTETLILNAIDNVSIAQAFGLTTMTKLVTTGPGDVNFTTNGYDFNPNTVIDVSASTGATTFDASAAKTNGFEYIGNAKVDRVNDNSVGGNIISTAAGKDVITLKTKATGASGVVITGGLDGDTIIATAAEGNASGEVIKLVFADGDSVIDASAATGNSITGFNAATMDSLIGLDMTVTAASGAGHVVTFDTSRSATELTFSSKAPEFGVTAVENAGDFYVFNTGSGGISYVYQDTDGDKLIEDGEFGIQLIGALSTSTTKDEFTIVDGNLLFSTLAG